MKWIRCWSRCSQDDKLSQYGVVVWDVDFEARHRYENRSIVIRMEALPDTAIVLGDVLSNAVPV